MQRGKGACRAELQVCIGAKVMLTDNGKMEQSAGNGCIGEVVQIWCKYKRLNSPENIKWQPGQLPGTYNSDEKIETIEIKFPNIAKTIRVSKTDTKTMAFEGTWYKKDTWPLALG